MKSKRYAVAVITSGAMIATMLAAAPAFADTATSQAQGVRGNGRGQMEQRVPGIFGTVKSISGTTLTVESIAREGRKTNGSTAASESASQTTSAATTYTVDASSAIVNKSGAASSLSAIAVGDTVMIEGTVSGTSVTAKVIHDGRQGDGTGPRSGAMANFKGDGKPIVGGTVSAVSGSTITITNDGGSTYTIDASSATVMKQGATSTVASIASGDKVIAQGTVSGSNVTATSVIDHGAISDDRPNGRNATSTNATSGFHPVEQIGRFFGGVGNLFHRMFGFF